MDIEITRHGLRITSTNQPMDDIVIEEVLGLYKEGDYVKLVRVSNKPVSLYVLETDPDICPVLAKTEAMLDGTGETMPSIDSAVETARQVLEKGENWESKGEAAPLPCPFCGADPKIILLDGDDPGIICGKIACINSQCPVQPEICDDRRVVEIEDSKACKAMLISLWNTRPTLV